MHRLKQSAAYQNIIILCTGKSAQKLLNAWAFEMDITKKYITALLHSGLFPFILFICKTDWSFCFPCCCMSPQTKCNKLLKTGSFLNIVYKYNKAQFIHSFLLYS